MSEDAAADAEEYVASLYRTMGFVVVRDDLRSGNQIDLIAEQPVPGFQPLRLAIEVKQRTKNLVGKEAVQSFAAVLAPLVRSGDVSGGVLVATTGFTRFAKAASREIPELTLKTQHDLEDEILMVNAPLVGYVNGYRDGRVRDHFIDLRMTHIRAGDRTLVHPDGHAMELLGLVERRPDLAVVLFADYGAGKTTTLERIKLKAAERYLQNRSALIPVLFLLRELPDVTELSGFIAQTIQRELAVSLSEGQFWTFLDAGRFLLLLDGFDEITLRADAAKRVELFRLLSPLLFGASPAILTSRPSYFVSHTEYKRVLRNIKHQLRAGHIETPGGRRAQVARSLQGSLRERYQPTDVRRMKDADYVAYSLDPVTSGQIDEYLDHFADAFAERGFPTSADARHFVDSIYDLSDLITRPILLDMIVQTILSGAVNPKDPSVQLGAAELYEIYTNLKLESDWDRAPSRREVLSQEERNSFAEKAALHMLRTGQLELEPHEADELAGAIVADHPDIPIDEIRTDLRTCSFLTTTSRGRLRFIHKSFQEFFVARQARDWLWRQDLSVIGTQDLPDEVRYFVGAFVLQDPALGEKVEQLILGDFGRRGTIRREIALTNLCSALLYGERTIRGQRWPALTIPRLKARTITIEDSTVDGLVIDELTVQAITVRASRLRGRWNILGDGPIRVSAERGSDVDLGVTAAEVDATSNESAFRLELRPPARLRSRLSYDIEADGGFLTLSASLSEGNVSIGANRTKVRMSGRGGQVSCNVNEVQLHVVAVSDAEIDLALTNSALLGYLPGSAVRCVLDRSFAVIRADTSGAVTIGGQESVLLTAPSTALDWADTDAEDLIVLGGLFAEGATAPARGISGVFYLPPVEGVGAAKPRLVNRGGGTYVIEGSASEVGKMRASTDQLIGRAIRKETWGRGPVEEFFDVLKEYDVVPPEALRRRALTGAIRKPSRRRRS